MTSRIDNNIDELMRRVKRNMAAYDFVFMLAYPPRELPNPINKYHVAAINDGVKTSQIFIGGAVGEAVSGVMYEVQLTLRVYAPQKTSGQALLRASSLIADAVVRTDSDRAVDEISLLAIGYDDKTRTSYRDIRGKLSYLIGEEAEDD